MDFIIANHFIEHCEDPIATMIAFFAKLMPHGVVYLAVPDKRFTFDQQRESTSIAHLQQDFSDGGVGSRTAHYLDFARYALLNGAATEREVAEWARQMIKSATVSIFMSGRVTSSTSSYIGSGMNTCAISRSSRRGAIAERVSSSSGRSNQPAGALCTGIGRLNGDARVAAAVASGSCATRER